MTSQQEMTPAALQVSATGEVTWQATSEKSKLKNSPWANSGVINS
jgi:hypothetical protein